RPVPTRRANRNEGAGLPEWATGAKEEARLERWRLGPPECGGGAPGRMGQRCRRDGADRPA
ncbi:MAG: hypothetical protein WEG36_04205, partial [Gemmatimonadota bacterium]